MRNRRRVSEDNIVSTRTPQNHSTAYVDGSVSQSSRLDETRLEL